MADDCGLLDFNCGVSNVVGGELEKFAKAAMEGANDLWNGFFTSWIGSGLDGALGGTTAEWFAGIALPIQAFLLTLGLMVAGIRTMLAARGEHLGNALKKMLRALGIIAAGTVFFIAMQAGSNALAKSILDAATEGTPAVLWDAATFSSNIALAVIFGLLAVFAVGIQWIIMILRAIAVTVLLPFWPITASAAIFDKYEGMWEKTTAWLLAALLYSPVAAAIYGLAIKLRDGRSGPEAAMYGLAVYILAIFALAAIMRLVLPITAAMGRASAGAMAMGAAKTAFVTAVAAGSAVATGGAAAPAAAGAAGATGGGAAAGSATSAGGAGATGAAGAVGPAGGSGAAGNAGGSGLAGGSGSSGSGSAGSGRSGWDAARDLGNAMPGGSRAVEDMIDE